MREISRHPTCMPYWGLIELWALCSIQSVDDDAQHLSSPISGYGRSYPIVPAETPSRGPSVLTKFSTGAIGYSAAKPSFSG